MTGAGQSPSEPTLVCPAFEEPATRAVTAAELALLGVGLVTLIVTYLALPRAPLAWVIEASGAVVAVLLIIWFLASPAKGVGKTRRALRNYVRYLFWDRLLRINSAALELVSCYYDDRPHFWGQSSPAEYYIGFPGDQFELATLPNVAVKDPLETNVANVREVLGGRTIRSHGPLYRIDGVQVDGPSLKLSFGPGCYADFVDTCDSVEIETLRELRGRWLHLLLRRIQRHPETWLPGFYRAIFPKLSARRQRAGDRDTLTDPNGKCLKLGINTVSLLRNSSGIGYTFLLGKRSNAIVEYPGRYHVVPAGSFEPSKRAYYSDPLEFSVFGSVLREYFEECFVGEHKTDYETNPPPLQTVIRQVGIRPVYDARNNPKTVEFRIMGVYFDLLSVKAEMTTCLVVHDPNYLAELERKSLLQSNWEYSGPLLKLPFSKSVVETWIGSETMLTIGRLALKDAVVAFPHLVSE